MEHDTLTFYKSGLFAQKWRWRYQAAGNGEKLANGGQGYSSPEWALASAFRVCGLGNPLASIGDTLVDTLVTREDQTEVLVRFR